MFLGSSRCASVAAGTLAKASLVGAKTVKGARAGEGAIEIASDDGGDEGGEIGHRLGELDDVLGGGSAFTGAACNQTEEYEVHHGSWSCCCL
jgi:hypothetical protein